MLFWRCVPSSKGAGGKDLKFAWKIKVGAGRCWDHEEEMVVKLEIPNKEKGTGRDGGKGDNDS